MKLEEQIAKDMAPKLGRYLTSTDSLIQDRLMSSMIRDARYSPVSMLE